MKQEKQILFDDPSSAIYFENIKGWVDINNRYFGDNEDSERLARFSSCTHTRCECGKLANVQVIDRNNNKITITDFSFVC